MLEQDSLADLRLEPLQPLSAARIRPLTTGMLSEPLELSLIVPTFNEGANIGELLQRLDSVLRGISWELIIVDDDSPDGTARQARDRARADLRVRCLQRIGRRGLSSACIEGMLASAAPVLCVMDADLQHDETRIPLMLERLRADERTDIVIATRYRQGGSVGAWDPTRTAMSRIATQLSRIACRQDVSDPMSGFFMLRRRVLDVSVRKLSGMGFKILLDMLASAPRPLLVQEVPFTFRPRFAGESKLDSLVAWDFGMLLVDKTIGRWVPARFVAFVFVGGLGVIVHMCVIWTLLRLGLPFQGSQAAATLVAIVFNFALNNFLTYRDRRLVGWRWWRGLATFALACGAGAAANVGIASYLFSAQRRWAIAALAGICVGAVWNYAITTVFTWARPVGR